MALWVRMLRGIGVFTVLTCLSVTVPLSAYSATSNQVDQPKPISDVLPLPVKVPQPKATTKKAQSMYRSNNVEITIDGTKMIKIPALHQHPHLPTGCEVTSLAMLLQALGKPVDKMQLAKEIKKDPTPIRYNDSGQISYWGNPEVGFVGQMDGSSKGFGVYHSPIAALLEQHMPNSAEDLTGQPFDAVLEKIDLGKPVVVWTTVPLKPTHDWSGWNTNQGPIKMTWNEHAVLLVGYGPHHVYINDPYDGTAAKRVDRAAFEQSWNQLGKQAVSVK